jgi:DNA-directed RNA polymerase subunit RPC12/RpoP
MKTICEKCKEGVCIIWEKDSLDDNNETHTIKCKKCGHTKIVLIDKRFARRNHRRGEYE